MLRTKTGLPSKAWRLQDSANVATIEHRESGARIRCIGSDPKRAHGLRPALAIMDEPGQYDPARAERMLAAMRTGLGKVPRSKLIALGTLPDHPTHWFARMFGTAGYSQMHRADPGADPFSMAAIRAANPSWNHLPSLRERVRRERTEARTDPAALASFLALRLNMGTPDIDRPELIAADRWEAAEAGAAEAAGPYALGIDLGQTAAMTAAAGFWPATGLLRCVAAFPSIPGLAQRGARDGVGALYKDMAERGELLVYPGHIVPVEAFLRDVLGKWGPPNAVAADRYKEGELRQGLSVAKVPYVALALRGQGFKDGDADVREFRRAILAGEVHPEPSLLLRSAMREATVVQNESGGAKLAKATQAGRRLRARDDAVAAAILAVAVGARAARGERVAA